VIVDTVLSINFIITRVYGYLTHVERIDNKAERRELRNLYDDVFLVPTIRHLASCAHLLLSVNNETRRDSLTNNTNVLQTDTCCSMLQRVVYFYA
jgi:hypothetical protein